MDFISTKESPVSDYSPNRLGYHDDSDLVSHNHAMNHAAHSELNALISSHFQHSVAQSVTCSGIGVHSGKRAQLTIHPAASHHGIIFRRMDLLTEDNVYERVSIPALYHNVVSTNHCSQLQNAHGVSMATVEHLMASFAGLGIDNALIDVTGPELPIMDGSSAEFIALINQAGRVRQNAKRKWINILRAVAVEDKFRHASFTPFSESERAESGHYLSMDYSIEFSAPIGRQAYHFDLGRDDFAGKLSAARTFCFQDEITQMHQHGLGLGGSLDNSLVIIRNERDGGQSNEFNEFNVLNPLGLRFSDECVRHKTLDAVGDLYLAGAPIAGHYRASRGGHQMTNLLLRALFSDARNYEIVG